MKFSVRAYGSSEKVVPFVNYECFDANGNSDERIEEIMSEAVAALANIKNFEPSYKPEISEYFCLGSRMCLKIEAIGDTDNMLGFCYGRLLSLEKVVVALWEALVREAHDRIA
jgi:hypothetical protein